MRFPLLSWLAGEAEDRIAPGGLNDHTNTVAWSVAVAMLTTAPCSAQVRVDVTPFFGSYLPTSDLFPVGTLPNNASPSRLRQNAGLAVGGRVTAWLTNRFAIDGSYGYSGSGAEQAEYVYDNLLSDYIVTATTTGHISIVSARLLLVVVGSPSRAALYLLGGPAYVGHRDQALDPGGLHFDIAGMTADTLGAVIGIGARFKVTNTKLAVRADLEHYRYGARFSGQVYSANWSSSRVQNDLVLSLGLSFVPGRESARKRR